MTTYPLVVQLADEIAQTSSFTFSLFLVILGAHRRIFSSSNPVRLKIPLLH
jgi:hypothetical protein